MTTEIQFLTSLARMLGDLETITLRRLAELERAAVSFKFHQHGENMITGAAPGKSCRIVETPVPAGGQLQAGSSLTWSTPDPLVALAPSTDGTSVVCTIDPSNKNSSFPLHLAGTASDGTSISGDVPSPGVPIIQPTPPTPVPATGFSFDQSAV